MRRGNLLRIGLCACLCAAGAVGAAELRKCEGKGGNSYVSGACPPGTREVWTRPVEPEPVVDTKREAAKQQRTAARSRSRSSNRGQRSRSAAQSTGPGSCEAAKRRRDDFRERHWYTITYEQLSALDQRVARACR